MVQVPATTDAADADFVTAALREGGVIGSTTRVAELEHVAIGEGVGIVGQLARLQLRYEGPATAAPGTVIVKLPSQYPENRAVGDHFSFYEREGRFYQQLASKVPIRIARCYWNHIDADRNEFGLLLEDLGDRTMISQVAGLSAARAASALRALARVHGTWWGATGHDGLDWMPRLDDPLNLAAGQQYRDAWPLFVERIDDALPDGALGLGERTQQVFEDLLRTSIHDAPVTVCHGDFRGDNLMFDDRAHPTRPEDEVAVLDWQIAYRGPAVTDVAYFLCQSLTVAERRAHERQLVGAWYDELEASAQEATGHDLSDYPFDLAWEQYRRASLGNTVYPVSAMGAMDPANERGRALVKAMAVRAFTAALDLRAEELLG